MINGTIMRRNNGEGTVYRKGDAWEAALYVNRRRRTTRAWTAKDAREKLRLLQRKAEEDSFVHDERITVAHYGRLCAVLACRNR